MCVMVGLFVCQLPSQASRLWVSPQDVPITDLRAQSGRQTSVIRGRLVAEDGRPIRRALVALESSDGQVRRRATTDTAGAFEFAGLPGGTYSVRGNAPGFASLEYGERAGDAAGGHPVTLAVGMVRADIVLTLPLAGVVTGRVLDESGVPVDNVPVYALAVEYAPDRELLRPLRDTLRLTDDRGRFRLFGLAPGDYYVITDTSQANARRDLDLLGYAPTYYPDSTHLAGASKVAVPASRPVNLADLVLVRTKTFTVSGTVGSDRGAAGGVELTLLSHSSFQAPPIATATSAPDGAFTFSKIPAGRYIIQALPSREPAADFASVALTVRGETAGVALRLRSSAPISGRVLLEGGTHGFATRELEVIFRPTDYSRSPIARGARALIGEDWRLRVNNLWGPHVIEVPRPPSGWALKEVRLDSEDVTDRAIDFDESLGQLDVVLTSRITVLSGSVSDAGNSSGASCSVLVVPADPGRRLLPGRSLQMVRADERGRYAVAGLAPGDYLAVAVDRIARDEWPRRARLESVLRWATPVTLREGESRSMNLRLVLRDGLP